jgi:aminoglycoside 6'-N-acetyltransferase
LLAALRVVTILTGHLVVLRPLVPADGATLRAIQATPKVARWWGPDEDPDWPLEPDSESQRFAVLERDSQDVIGMVQIAEENDPQYRHAGVDIMLDPRVHSRGLGTDAVRTVVRHLLDDLGHHRVTIDPALANAAAIRCYEKVGFRRVGVMRRYERSPGSGIWRDGLLMDLLAEDLT